MTDEMTAKLNHFDRSKPFYPLVMLYLVQLFGFKDMALRGIVGSPTIEELLSRWQRKFGDTGDRAKLTKAAGPLELRSEYQGDTIEIDADLITQELATNAGYLMSYMMRSAASLLILAYETTKDQSCRDDGPLWEFLRHCRNAAAHGGTFSLRNAEPRNRAVWGSLEITRQSNGVLLFKNDQGSGLLSPGDPIRLLWDIEQAYPSISVSRA